MKKQLLFEFARFVFGKTNVGITAFAVLTFMAVQSSFAQSWPILAAEGSLASSTTSFSSYASITMVGEVPYVVYTENTTANVAGTGIIKKRNTDGSWSQVGGNLSASTISFTRIYSDKTGKLYVMYIDNTNGSKLAVKKLSNDETTWELLVGATDEFVSSAAVTLSTASATNYAGSTNVRSALAFDSANVPYVTYSANGIPYVMKFSAGAWVGVGSTSSTPGLVSTDITAAGNGIALDSNNVPYVVYILPIGATSSTSTLGAIKVFRLNADGLTWDNVSPVSPVSTARTDYSRHVAIAIDGDNKPVVSFYSKFSSSTTFSAIIRGTIDATGVTATATWDLLKTTSTVSADFKSNNLIKDVAGNLYSTFMYRSTTSSRIQVFKRDLGTDIFYELIDTPATTGVETYTGNTTTINNPPEIAVGSNTTKPYVVYIKASPVDATVSQTVLKPTTPVVRSFDLLITSTAVSDITATSATAGGQAFSSTSSVLGTLTERGIVYNTATNPTTANTKIADGATTVGVFTSSITGLTAATTYYARAYAIYSDGAATPVLTTVYGDNKIFTTTAALATNSFEKEDTVKAYPNPTTDSVTVSLPNGAVVQKIAVYNTLGQLLFTKANNTVSLQNLAKGNYYLTIYTAEGNYAKQIIKQ